MMRYLFAIAALALAGCTTTPVHPVIPQTVQVVVTKFVPVPAWMTAPCAISELRTGTGFDALDVGHQRKVSLLDCNARMDAIRGLK